MTLGIRLRTAAVLAALAIALIFAACGGDGGIDFVSDEERQDREATLDSEAGLGDDNSSDARDDTLDQELDGDRRSSDDAGDAQAVAFSIAGAETTIDLLDLPCSSDEGLVRTSDGGVGCASVAALASIVSCDEGSRPVVDLADFPADADLPHTECVPLDDKPDDVFDEEEIDD